MTGQKKTATCAMALTLMVIALSGILAPRAAPAATPQLKVAMTASPNPVLPGQSVLYTITVSNLGGAASGPFYVSMPIPAYGAASYWGASPELSGSTCLNSGANGCLPGQVVTWYYSSGLAAGAGTTFQLPVMITSSSPPANGTSTTTTATAKWQIGATKLTTSASASVIIDSQPLPEVSLSDGPVPLLPGGTLSYVVNFANPTASAVNLGLSLPLPSGTSLKSASGNGSLLDGAVVWDLGSVPAGASGQQQVILQVAGTARAGTLLSTTANLYDHGTGQSYARATRVSTVVTPPAAGGLLTIGMSAAPDPVQPGQPLLYTITVSNIGGAASGPFYVSMPIPAHSTASYWGASPELSGSNCSNSGANGCLPGQVVTWYYAVGLAAGASTTFQLPVTVASSDAPPNGTVLTTAAHVVSDSAISGGASAVQSVSVSSARTVELAVSDGPNLVTPGGTLSYVVNFANPTGGAVNADLSLPLPPGTSLVSASGGGLLSADDAVVWELGSLAAGASGQRQVTLKVASDVPEGTLLSTTADLYSPDPDTQPSYARATRVSTAVTPPAAAGLLDVSMGASPDPAHPGQVVLYRITVSNIGGAASGPFYVSMPIPAYSTASYWGASPELSGSNCSNSGANGCLPGQVVTWYYSAGLAAGASATFQLPVTLDASGAPPNASLLTTGTHVISDSSGGGGAAAAVLTTAPP